MDGTATKSLTATNTKDAKEDNSLIANGAEDAKETIIDAWLQGR